MKHRGVTGAAIGLLALVAAIIAFRHQSVEAKTAMLRADPGAILGDAGLRSVALKHGRAVFRAHCASCHGEEGGGSALAAAPDLTDGDFLYGQGAVNEIEQIVLHGIRAGDARGWNLALMPGFARPVPYAREALPPLTPVQTADIVAFLRAAGGSPGYDPAQVGRGRALFGDKAGCWDCHGHDARGDSSIGAPNLVDGKWLAGDGSEAAIRYIVERGMAGVSPAFAGRLSAYDARTVAVYTASLHPPAR